MRETGNRAQRHIGSLLKQAGIPLFLASLAEDYAKRMLESRYDRLTQTRLFLRLKSMSDRDRLVVEFMLYAVNACLKARLPGNTPWGAFLKGLLTDFFPEFGRRLINGDSDEGREVLALLDAADGREGIARGRH